MLTDSKIITVLPVLDKTRDHIAEMEGHQAAWFKDPDGNILCIHQS